MVVTMKNVVFWDIKTRFVPHRRHVTTLLQSMGKCGEGGHRGGKRIWCSCTVSSALLLLQQTSTGLQATKDEWLICCIAKDVWFKYMQEPWYFLYQISDILIDSYKEIMISPLVSLPKHVCYINKTKSVPLVCKRNIPTEQPPLVGEI
jgi:hypothetical protein